MKNKTKSILFKNLPILLTIIAIFFFSISPALAKPRPKVLVFCKTAGYHHASIANGIAAIEKLGAENNFDVDTTINAEKFNAKNLKQYKAIIFLSTTGDVLNDEQQEAFKKYIEAGGGYMGIHAATDCEYDWQWYGNLSGAYFGGHPAQQNTNQRKDLPGRQIFTLNIL